MTTLFYRLPRLAALAIMVALAGGLGAISTLGRQEDPTLVERFGFVLTTLPGADAERIEALVTDPIETALGELAEINNLRSVSRAGVSQVSIEMDESLSASEVEDAWTLVRQQVAIAESQLPPGTSTPEIDRQYVGATTLIVGLIWERDTPPELGVLSRLARDLEDRLQIQPGTDQTDIFGLPSEEIRVVMDTEALAATGLSLNEAAQLIAAADAREPAGQLRAGGTNLNLEVGGEFESIARIRAAPLIQREDGSAIRVSDVAEVRKGLVDPPAVLGLNNNQRTVLVGTFIQTNQRVDLWAANARRVIEEFAATAPTGIGVEVLFDQSQYTEARLNGLAQNLGYSALIVFAVLFFVMGWRAAIVVGSALPLTVCLVLILFSFFQIPLHQMSVTGLVISLGLLIDNAIVVNDDYDQLRGRGVGRMEAIDKALRHLFGPLAASTLTTALAFTPIALLPGSAGEFVGMIGTSVIFSVSSSLLIAMTVIPALGGWLDGKRDHPRRWWRDGIAPPLLSDGYRATIEAVLRFPPLGLAIGIAPALLGFWLSSSLPLQFFPATERDQLLIEMQLPSSASITDTEAEVRRATDLLLDYDGVENVNWTLGEGAPRVYYNTFNNTQGVAGFAAGWVQLDSAQRSREIVDTLQRDMRNAFPNAQFLVLPFEQGPPVNAPIELLIRGDNLSELNRLGDAVRSVLAATPGLTYTSGSLQLGAPTITFRADEAATAMAGERLGNLAADIAADVEGVLAGSVLEGVEELPVRVLANNQRRAQLSDLRSKTIGGNGTDLGAPLAALGDVTLDPATSVITREDGRRTNTILGFLSPYALPAPALEQFEERLEASGFTTPSGYLLEIGGEAEARGDATSDLAALALPLVLIMAGAVALVFNSFRLSLLILITGGLSVGMAFFGVWLFNLPMGFTAIIGSLGLLGIAINGSIVVLTQLRTDEASRNGDLIAQREVVVDATRHIVATTLTTMGGFVPLILSGDAFWLPLATGIAVGVAGSALLALYFVPAAYRLGTVFRRAPRGAVEPAHAMAQPAE